MSSLNTNPKSMNLFVPPIRTAKATFAFGCFWGVEALFEAVHGVIRVKAGYTGGTKANPTYNDLGDHTEAVEIDYDPDKLGYNKLLSLFWNSHDPTSYSKRQYMSAIYYHDEVQKQAALKSRNEQFDNLTCCSQARLVEKIKTQIVPASTFYDAEDFHQKYYLRNVPDLFKSLNLEGSALKESYVAAKLNGYISGHGKYNDFVEISKFFGLTNEQRELSLRLVKSPPFRKCH